MMRARDVFANDMRRIRRNIRLSYWLQSASVVVAVLALALALVHIFRDPELGVWSLVGFTICIICGIVLCFLVAQGLQIRKMGQTTLRELDRICDQIDQAEAEEKRMERGE
jgi:protein-S-isoprenylcysteine O-methyltransferase Ste14